jgi:hypothetical protein
MIFEYLVFYFWYNSSNYSHLFFIETIIYLLFCYSYFSFVFSSVNNSIYFIRSVLLPAIRIASSFTCFRWSFRSMDSFNSLIRSDISNLSRASYYSVFSESRNLLFLMTQLVTWWIIYLALSSRGTNFSNV